MHRNGYVKCACAFAQPRGQKIKRIKTTEANIPFAGFPYLVDKQIRAQTKIFKFIQLLKYRQV